MKRRLYFATQPCFFVLLILMAVARPVSAQLPYFQSFKDTSAPGLVIGGSPSAFLTAGKTVSYGYSYVTDPINDGYLRLTPDSSAVGYVYNNTAFPAQNGLRVSVEYFMYSKNYPPADGFTFFLFNGATTSFNIGSYGGGLGYNSSGSTPGVSNGYLGIGFDVYGNYSGGNGGPGQVPNSVVIRGSGNGTTGYNYLTAVSPGFTLGSGTARVPDSTMSGYRRAIITLVPKAVTGGYSYNISVTIVTGGTTPVYNTIINNYTGFSDVAPTNLKYGFAASTGALVEAHEIRNLRVDAYTQPTGTPTATADSVNMGCASNTQIINVLNNDVPVNQPLAFDSTSVRLINPANINDTGKSYTIAGVGTFSADSVFGASGKVYFTPVASFSGNATIRYVVQDNYGKRSNAALITVNASARALILAATTTNPTCNGGANGSVTINGSTNPAGYTYALGTAAYQTSGTFSGLGAGTFLFHTKNSNGCIRDTSITLTQPAALTVSKTQTNVLCNGGSTGSATLTAGGGTTPYQYALGSGTYGSSNVFSGLAAGTYTLNVKDANNCTATTTVTITQPAALTVSASQTNVLCNGGSTGSATLTAGGGTTPYQYALGSGTYGTNNVFNGLAAGTYTLNVKDANNCTTSTSVTITQPAALTANKTQTNVLCNGGSTGSATLIAAGGTTPYQYALGSGAYSTNNVFNGLAAGTYTLNVKDANNCTTSTTVTITQPAALTVSASQTNVLCNGGSTGSATLTAGGGTTPYQYALGSGTYGSSNVFNGLAAGTYTLNVKDANNCTISTTVTITQPAALTANKTQTNVLCNGGSTGSATLTAGGGTTPYQYALGSGTFGSSNVFSGLAAGTYTLNVKDANNCTASTTVTITQPAALTVGASQTNVLCNGGATGSATLTAGGGTTPYQYALGSGAYGTNNVFNGLAAGTYTLNVKDANNCTASTSVTITQPAALTANKTQTNVLCNGGLTGSATLTAVGGTAPYQYALGSGTYSTNNVFNGLTAGTYTLNVKDANNCTANTSVTITQPALLTVSASQTNVLCNGGSTGSATLTAGGGTTPYQYALGSGTYGTNNLFNGLAAGTYILNVKDANNCTATTTVTITQPAALTLVTSNVQPINCFGDRTGSIFSNFQRRHPALQL